MELLRNLSIRWKVIHMIMFTMTVALLAACAAFMTYDYVAFRDLQIEGLADARRHAGHREHRSPVVR